MMATLGQSRPTHRTTIGARAMIGIVWLAITYGTRARSSSRECTNRMASPRPMAAPSTNPMAAPRHVNSAASMRTAKRLNSLRRVAGSNSAPTISHTCGRFVSLSCVMRSGGWCGGSSTIPNASRQIPPPIHFAASQRTAMMSTTTMKARIDRTIPPTEASASPTSARRPNDAVAPVIGQATAASVISSARSMIANPSASSSSLMVSGGLVWK